jgi:structural maintenance of chromosome 3 (chondroitin sulfate proteoglycan 6)
LQLGGRKATLELELKESLRRRRDELIAKIDNIDDGPNLQNDDAGDLGARKEELARLGKSIASLDSRIEGKLHVIPSRPRKF